MPSRWIARVVASTASVWMVTSTLAFADPPARVAENQLQHRRGVVPAAKRERVEHGVAELSAHHW